MSQVSKEDVLRTLEGVSHPAIGGSIVEKNLVSDIFIADGKVYFSITVAANLAEKLEPLRIAAENAVKSMDGVDAAMVALTAEKKPGAAPAPAKGPSPAQQQQPPQKAGVPGVGAIIAVASGKGGVGKSTTAVNLALGLQAIGLRVGILDADIYGPSMPRLLNVGGQPEQTGERMLRPKEAYGLKVMSMGFLVAEETPMIWRGPMVVSALTQMLREVDWGELDVIVVDMPPGTGDAQLTMAQKVPLAGAVIVSTPQDLALIDARKGLNMFKKVDVPLLGLIENMSYFQCPSCGERSNIFGHGGARDEAERIGVPFLGEVPLHMGIRENSDAGTPVVVAQPDGPHALIFREIAEKVRDQLHGSAQAEVAAPRIVFE
ncbi:Mrp/NBP35 family ATP-binding protein [Hoeflea poritis]|uniref:Iron-sulfur cluster carrier protein n=1 Tax=Hoeflea poritis TaxID=2993659 RepID=A0ABT4VKG6_9HYPH|nr:Mrp/NBP35 family ATP-binding protein [Hoeflea poritis]MDA4844650.1 Mrp/NBP35 family ATP-binding protein [Hoeflea poritis]